MRILILDANPGLGQRSYEEQWRALIDTFFGTADAHTHYLQELRHDPHEVVANCEPLQRAWASERGRGRSLRSRWRRRPDPDLVLVQAEWFEPDVVYLQNVGYFAPDTLGALEARSRLLAGQIASEGPRARRRSMRAATTRSSRRRSAPIEFGASTSTSGRRASPISRRYRGEAWALELYSLWVKRASPSTGTSTSRKTARTTCGSTRRPASARSS